MSNMVHQFDWYQATVPAHHELLCQALLKAIGPDVQRRPGRGMWSYLHSETLELEGEPAARIFYGGRNPQPNVSSTGDHGPALAAVLRTVFPAHRVTRCDVALDMRGEGVFDDVVARMGTIGRRHQLKGERWLPDDLDDGTTYYLGSRKSPIRVRCYEKGKQLFKLTGDAVWKSMFDWTRLEIQVRPEKDFKSAAATMQPEQFWGCTPWTRQLVSEVVELNPEPVAMKPSRISDHERAMRHLVQQYGPTLLRQLKRLGTPQAFLDDLLHRLDPDAHPLAE